MFFLIEKSSQRQSRRTFYLIKFLKRAQGDNEDV